MRNHIQLTWRHSDVNLQGERANSTLQTSITTFASETHRRRDAAGSEKITRLITEMTALLSAATMYC